MAIEFENEQEKRDTRMLVCEADAEVPPKSRARKVSWKPVRLEPAYSSKIDQGSSYKALGNDEIRKHLLYLGWYIDSRRDTMIRYRYRFEGKTYYSLKQVYNNIQCLCGSQSQRETRPNTNSTDQPEPEEDGTQDRNGNDTEMIESELPESVKEYIDLTENKTQRYERGYVQYHRSNAKKHLISVGYTVCMRSTATPRPRLFYKSPAGKIFGSLVEACRDHIKNRSSDTGSLRTVRVKVTDENAKTLNKSLKRKQSVLVSPEDSPISQLSVDESNQKNPKKIKSIHTQVDRTIEREKVANSKGRGNGLSTSTSPSSRTKTILSLLINKEIVIPRTRISYRPEISGHSLKEGWITCTGIHCTCCNQNFSVPDFESHAGAQTKRPLDNIYLKDGRSLLDCLVQVMERDRPGAQLYTRFKVDEWNYEMDGLCSVCREEGEVIMCNTCTSTYHASCLGITGELDEDWRCPSCSCKFCESSEFHPEADISSAKTVVYCDQCENEYHIGCSGSNYGCQSTRYFCSKICSTIWERLDDLVGVQNPTSREGYTWSVLKYAQCEGSQSENLDRGTTAELNAKLCLAAEVLNETFMPTGESDFISDMVFNEQSKHKRFDCRGFYTIVLEKGDEVVSVATLRVHGDQFVEVPLVATSSQVRKQGLCRLLMSSVEQLINHLEIKKIILPAAPQKLEMWRNSFGFNLMNEIELNNLCKKYKLVKFFGCPMCQKII